MSKLIPNIFDINNLKDDGVESNLWTAVIPAAGIGSRLGCNHPKILYPLLGRPILDWLLDSLASVVSQYVFILSPKGLLEVEPFLESRLAGRYKVVIQECPTGMGDAVLLAENAVDTPYTLVIWGDQITITPKTLRVCAALHQSRSAATLTLPSLLRKNPYINLIRNSQGLLVDVHQAREGEVRDKYGENDCGVFLFTSKQLFKILAVARNEKHGIGNHTFEFNLLPTLPRFECGVESVYTVRIHNINETFGVNTKEDAHLAEIILRKSLKESSH